ncbi:hypothetical protein L208DRAFT_1090252, partial [Tricholoma matsutake]
PLDDTHTAAKFILAGKITHLSGAGKYIDKIDQDIEDLGVLSYDRASSSILDHALLCSTSHLINVGA